MFRLSDFDDGNEFRGSGARLTYAPQESSRGTRQSLGPAHAGFFFSAMPATFTTSPGAADRRCSFTIVIGRRDNSKKWFDKRNRRADRMSNRYRVNIRSFDYLTDELGGRQFAHSSPILLSGDKLDLNRLANPFTKAFTDKLWRALIRRLKQNSPEELCSSQAHFFTCKKSEIVECLKHNSLFDAFLSRQGIAHAQHPE